MRKFMFALAALATFGGSAVVPAQAEGYYPGIHAVVVHPPFCRDHFCGLGPARHRVCAVWEIFGGDRHCARWRYVW